MEPFKALYCRQCSSSIGWFKTSKIRPRGTNFLFKLLARVRVIWDRLRAAQINHKSYEESRLCTLILLHVSPMKGVMRFKRKVKLSPKHIGPFEIHCVIGELDYELALSLDMVVVHPIFHVFVFK